MGWELALRYEQELRARDIEPEMVVSYENYPVWARVHGDRERISAPSPAVFVPRCMSGQTPYLFCDERKVWESSNLAKVVRAQLY